MLAGEILTMADALLVLRDLIPGVVSVIESHIEEQGLYADPDELEAGVAPYWLFTEVREFVFEDASKVAERAVGLFAFMELALVSPSQSVRDGSLIRVAHKLYRYEEAIRDSGVTPGPHLMAAMG